MKNKVIVVDYGHGGSDPGATNGRLREKDIVLQIGRKITKLLRSQGFTVIETRTGDQTLSLKQRTDIANASGAVLFVSIHVNSFRNDKANGVETFSHPNSNPGAKLTKNIQNELVKTGLFKSNRGVKTANFYVLRNTSMPASLVELGFIKNPHDINVMTNKQDELAQAVTNGILAYLGEGKMSTSSTKRGWLKESDIWYYYQSGKKHKGWIKLNDLWYYLNSRGELQTGWFQVKTGGPFYYADGGGRMQTGWLKDGGRWFYLFDSGRMATGLHKIDDKYYFFNLGGRMTEDQFFTLYADKSGEVYYKSPDK